MRVRAGAVPLISGETKFFFQNLQANNPDLDGAIKNEYWDRISYQTDPTGGGRDSAKEVFITEFRALVIFSSLYCVRR